CRSPKHSDSIHSNCYEEQFRINYRQHSTDERLKDEIRKTRKEFEERSTFGKPIEASASGADKNTQERDDAIAPTSGRPVPNRSPSPQKLSKIERTNTRRNPTIKIKVIVEYRQVFLFICSPSKEDTFRGTSLEDISRAVPGNNSLTVETVNYLKLPLERLKLILPFRKEFHEAPTHVCGMTREVFTFRGGFPKRGVIPEIGVSYRVGNLHIYLLARVYGAHGKCFALGFLPAEKSVKTLFRPPSQYKHSGTTWSFRFIVTVPKQTTKRKEIYERDLCARGSYKMNDTTNYSHNR
ncbi:unnamed protein product, partial [Allacma fusca]